MQTLTESQRILSRKYILYKIFTNLWFVSAVWLYFYRLFITDQQVGVLDGIAFAIGLIAEVPSGALADKFGRDKLVKLGQILSGTGLLIQAFSTTLPFFIFGQAMMMIGVSFVSGADDALFYDELNFDKSSANWRKLVTRGSQAGLIATLVTTILGGVLHQINPQVPWILNGIIFFLAAATIWSVVDSRPRQERKPFLPELKDYLLDIKTGFEQFRSSKLWFYVPFIITVQGLFYTSSYGLLKLVLLDRFHFDSFAGSVVVAICGLITVGLLAFMHKHSENIREKLVLVAIGLTAAVSLIFSAPDVGIWGFLVILVLYAGDYILVPVMSEVLNTHAPETQRATVLSVASFFKTLPYIALAPIIGYLNTNGKLGYFLIGWSVLIVLTVILYFFAKGKDTKITVAEE